MPAWLERASPASLAIYLGKSASDRKSGLFIRHLCRCFAELFPDPRSLAALDAADRFEAGEIDQDDLDAALRASGDAQEQAQAGHDPWSPDAWAPANRMARTAVYAAQLARNVAVQGFYPNVLTELRRLVLERTGAGGGPRKNPTARAMRPVFLEHFGDTQRPAGRDPSWLTGTVLALAEGVYAESAFDRLPILADALQDAGCDDADVLGHCRGPGPHARGCWVVDLVLGKS